MDLSQVHASSDGCKHRLSRPVMRSVVNFQVDCTAEGKQACKDYGVKGFPTLKLLYPDGKGGVAEVAYKSARSLDALYNFAVSASEDPAVRIPLLMDLAENIIITMIPFHSLNSGLFSSGTVLAMALLPDPAFL